MPLDPPPTETTPDDVDLFGPTGLLNPTLTADVRPVVPLGSNAVSGPTLVAGRYLLGERLGAGGMGLVFRAEQTHPVQRVVALKLIKPGMDTDEFLIRFEAERQAVARMDHPNIARVYDAGTADGRPFIALELVEGVPLVRYCDARKLTLRQRVELFVPVCRAVQHAHQKGVIHRDLKPSNVLVAEVDGRPVPKVIDFGIAKAVGGDRLADAHTRTGVVIGTPEYMSPEQAGAAAADIDTRSDVYTLGVMLYELLTGSTPFTRPDTGGAVWDLLRRVCEEDPPRPRAKLSAPTTATRVAADRGGDPARLRKDLSGELDWVVMKALDRDRERRYQTAAALADDLERYLRDEPLDAGPPSRGYRLRKFVARNRVAVTAGAVTALALVGGTVAACVGLVRSRQAEQVAVAALGREADARRQAERSADEATAGRVAAQDAQRRTRAALLAFTDEVAEGFLGRAAQLTPDEQRFLTSVQGQLAKFATEAGRTADDRAVAGECRGRLGVIQVRLGRLAEGEASLQAAVAELERFTGDDAVSLLARFGVSRFASELGTLCLRTNRPDEALGWMDRAVRAGDELVAAAPTAANRARLAQARGVRGNYWGRVGRLDRAEAELTAAQALFDELVRDGPRSRWRLDQAANRDMLGGVYDNMRRDADAVREWRAAADTLEELTGETPDEVKARVALAAVYSQTARLVGRTDPAEAHRCYRRAVAVRRQLAADFPAVPQYRADYAVSAANYASRLTDDGRPAEAEPLATDALAMRERLAADFPAVTTYRIYLAHSLCTSGRLARLTARPQRAGELLDRAVREIDAAYRAEPARPLAREVYAMCYRERAELHGTRGEFAAAAADWRTFRTVAKPRDGTWATARMALALANAGQAAEAVRALDALDDPDWKDAGVLLARVSAVLAATEPDAAAKERHAARAVLALKKAVSAGAKDPLAVYTDPDFAPLSGRADFRAVLASLPPERLPPPRPVVTR